jgi:hypothetical protein
MGILGAALSKKYEVEHGYFLIDGNKTLTEAQKKIETDKLDKEGEKLDHKIIFLAIAGFTSFVVATSLLMKRKAITKS